jgi:hypothetical protein
VAELRASALAAASPLATTRNLRLATGIDMRAASVSRADGLSSAVSGESLNRMTFTKERLRRVPGPADIRTVSGQSQPSVPGPHLNRRPLLGQAPQPRAAPSLQRMDASTKLPK